MTRSKRTALLALEGVEDGLALVDLGRVCVFDAGIEAASEAEDDADNVDHVFW